MKIYILLPFYDVKENCSNNLCNGELTSDYAANFGINKRYMFESQDRIEPEEKHPYFKFVCSVWMYRVINPETFKLYREEKDR